jgi:hypothetical protein
MKIRTMLNLAAVGTILYFHRRNGGEFTVESAKQSLKDLWDAIGKKADEAKRAAKDVADDVADKVEDKAKVVAQKAKTIESNGFKPAR